jgi:hypothetical protein|tara:strand:- start:69212 stop:69613 length:402 start_codon:yes stop_codon:yes gene_type:complete
MSVVFMNRIILLGVLIFTLVSCGGNEIDGEWRAVWEIRPASFENIENITSFKMDGRFLFKEDSVIIMAYGYEGCIFGVDTIQHAQSWKISGDTLYLLNEANLQGISYLITSKTDQSIELQLMDDIFIHLNKVL